MQCMPVHLSSPSVSSSTTQSSSSSNSYSSGGCGTDYDCTPYRGLRPAKVVTQQDMPFSLRMHNRSPREILEKKAEMKREDKAGVEDVEEDDDVDKMVVEGEIQVTHWG